MHAGNVDRIREKRGQSFLLARSLEIMKYLTREHFLRIFKVILYLKFKLSNEKTAFVPCDNVIFYGISLKFMISQCSVRYYNIPRQIHRGIL